MIPILDAIDTGAWLQAKFRATEYYECQAADEGDVTFRLRVREFEKIDLMQLDNPENLSGGISLESNIWRVSLDIVNLCKKELRSYTVRDRIILHDAEGYEFKVVTGEKQLTHQSGLADSLGITTFHFQNFPPKIRKYGAYAFDLPDEFEELYLSIVRGELREA